MYKSILVGFDGSRKAVEVAEKACRLAEIHDARVHLLTVIPPTTIVLGELMTPETLDPTPIRQAAEAKLRETISRLREKYNIEITYSIQEGDPAETILEEAQNHDLIIIGKRTLTTLERLILGSTAKKIIEKTSKDTLIIP